VRLAQRVNSVIVQIRDGFAVKLVSATTIELKVPGQGQRVSARLLQRLAHVQRFHFGQGLGLVGNRTTDACEQPAPLGRSEPSPGAIHGGTRRNDCGIDVGGLRRRDFANLLACRRVLERKDAA
jgi:hypothetical protein